MNDRTHPIPAQPAHAYDADFIRVVGGANLGDPIGDADAIVAGDLYRLNPAAPALRLMLQPGPAGHGYQILAQGSQIGRRDDRLSLRALLTLMAPDGDRLELLVVRHEEGGKTYALPLSPMVPRTDYALLAVDTDFGNIRIADIICVSFAAGTLITGPDGAQRSIDTLAPGELILTRDHGPQPVRWVGKATFRANGTFAPVVIRAGTLGNLGDLVVSPHHRVFLYQRGKKRVGGTAELLVQAKHLVDGEAIIRREGGFVDYYSLVFDRHEIIYAEGIPAESLLINDTTVGLLPEDLAAELKARFPGLSQRQHFGTEARREDLDAAGRAALFRRDKGS
ncbi:MAG: Hint domain-containing protein [Rhodobacteraceae bacterium]|nr:Hint domain-containing protein [Paracoccaceae bacterium]MCP5341725.1 Hint domain-containing protein [Paracoccaceae bacterium]